MRPTRVIYDSEFEQHQEDLKRSMKSPTATIATLRRGNTQREEINY